MPSPVTALSATEPSCVARSRSASSGARSALLNATSSGTWSAPISASTSRTARMLPPTSGALASTTWTSRSASTATSSVDRNASTSWWGSLRMNPTVSVSSTDSPPGSVEAAGGGVERGEQAVLDQHAGVGQAVEQRRLAGVRVADDHDLGELAPALGLALGRAVAVDLARGRPRACGCGARCAGGRPRAASRPGRGCRCGRRRRPTCRRPAATARRPGAAAAAAGSGAGPARPAPCPPGCGRSGRRCRGSPRCGRWPCGRAASRG